MSELNTVYPELFAMAAGVTVFLLTLAFLDWLIPHNVEVKRVGGITFVRWGRWSFSYCKRKPEA